MQFREYKIQAPRVRSLSWQGDALVDWVGGGAIYRLDGSHETGKISYAYRFDAAVASPGGRFSAIYERRGTKGLLLDQGTILRELNRSFYHAHDYNYPIAFVQLDGREFLAHCPEEYCRLEFEEVLSGKRAASKTPRKPSDFFHSNLLASPSGRFLLDAGWVWHPWQVVMLHDMGAALEDAAWLDRVETDLPQDTELYGGAFLDEQTVVLLGSGDGKPDSPDVWDRPHVLAVYDRAAKEYRSVVSTEEAVGSAMPVGDRHVIGFHGHPRLFDVQTGAIVHRWPHLPCGSRDGWFSDPALQPPLALDASKRRFALADGVDIVVVECGIPFLE